MKKGILLLIIAMQVCMTTISAQIDCSSDEIHLQKIPTDPSLRKKRADIENIYTKTQRSSSIIDHRTIGVYFHVIYNSEVPNYSTAQLQAQLDVLNADINGVGGNVNSIPAEFSSLLADYNMTFKIEGVTRQPMPNGHSWVGNSIKDPSQGGVQPITPLTHLNVWISKGGSFATFPNGPSHIDGIALTYTNFGTHTLTHEVGHYLNLIHIWGGGSNGCSIDDLVADTPNAKQPNLCPSSPVKSCPDNPYTTDMYMNFMDGGDCTAMFTHGQKSRSMATLEVGGGRECLGSDYIPEISGPNTWYSTCPRAFFVHRYDLVNPTTDNDIEYNWSINHGAITKYFYTQQGKKTGIEVRYSSNNIIPLGSNSVNILCTTSYLNCPLFETGNKSVAYRLRKCPLSPFKAPLSGDLPKNKFQIYPNPTGGLFNINYFANETGNINIDIVSASNGTKFNILKEFQNAGNHSISLDYLNLANGVYFVIITDQSGTISKRVVLE